jgi:hypothetical protein
MFGIICVSDDVNLLSDKAQFTLSGIPEVSSQQCEQRWHSWPSLPWRCLIMDIRVEKYGQEFQTLLSLKIWDSLLWREMISEFFKNMPCIPQVNTVLRLSIFQLPFYTFIYFQLSYDSCLNFQIFDLSFPRILTCFKTTDLCLIHVCPVCFINLSLAWLDSVLIDTAYNSHWSGLHRMSCGYCYQAHLHFHFKAFSSHGQRMSSRQRTSRWNLENDHWSHLGCDSCLKTSSPRKRQSIPMWTTFPKLQGLLNRHGSHRS